MRRGVGEEHSGALALLDAGRPGERPVIRRIFRSAVDCAKGPVST